MDGDDETWNRLGAAALQLQEVQVGAGVIVLDNTTRKF